ncbi:MAG: DUF1570 domain-containing protein [Planctomycetaceae bacterium]|nr:DUF1570 domain-containing protein [Planctomycetales bacterium]MCB9937683.1 DUF1570 domain-containing protein [Planctomycetaceae bacterium]
MNRLLLLKICLVAAFVGDLCLAIEHVSIERDGKSVHVDGKIVVEAADGGLLIEDAGGMLWAITPDEIVNRDSDAVPFKPADQEAMSEQLLREFPDGFRIHNTAHYLVCYNTSQAYAEWCGSLYERLFLAFNTYWKNRGFSLNEPDVPLVALVFDDQRSFAAYASPELGEATSKIIGYYSLRSNRVVMYDLTGSETAGGGRGSTAAHINQLLMRPGAERTVATVIHEATHQIAFNCGLQTRYADIPLWVSEGVAIYFETPDLRSSKGWRNIGGVNQVRLQEFGRYFRNRPADSLLTLISTDDRFRDPRQAGDAYAEAWSLNYFLIRKHLKEYLQYMKVLSEKRPLRYDDPEDRVAQFKEAFGDDLEQLNTEFIRYMRTVR